MILQLMVEVQLNLSLLPLIASSFNSYIYMAPNPSSRILPSVGAFTVQCAAFSKWKLIPTKEKYGEIRDYILELPFVCELACEWQPEISAMILLIHLEMAASSGQSMSLTFLSFLLDGIMGMGGVYFSASCCCSMIFKCFCLNPLMI